jgi:hypothetical protein
LIDLITITYRAIRLLVAKAANVVVACAAKQRFSVQEAILYTITISAVMFNSIATCSAVARQKAYALHEVQHEVELAQTSWHDMHSKGSYETQDTAVWPSFFICFNMGLTLLDIHLSHVTLYPTYPLPTTGHNSFNAVQK